MKHDDFGDRMKEYESFETDRRLTVDLPVYARLDGRGFSRFTKGMNRPYDYGMSEAMIEVTKYLVKETHARMGYTQSDEISLVWENGSAEGSQLFFDGKIQKLTSVLAGIATSKFMHQLYRDARMAPYADRMPHFDCRVFSVPSRVEAANALLWREMDATKNSVTMAASHYFSHRSLQGVNSAGKLQMLGSKGVDFNEYPAFFTRGTFVQRKVRLIELTEGDRSRIPEIHRPPVGTMVERSFIEELDMPPFRTVINRVGVVFNNELPLTATV